jgi:hypothetical protein
MRRSSQLLIAFVALTVAMLHGQQNEKSYSVRGAVINALSGEPIPRALVVLQDSDVRMGLTDANGRFEFDGIHTEPTYIRVGKKGFILPGELSPDKSIENVAAEANSQSDSVVVKLSPASAIVGRIVSPDGEPLEEVPVQLFYHGLMDGEVRLQPHADVLTDEEGGFSFNDLPAGQYFIVAGPKADKPLVPVERPGIPYKSYGQFFYPGGSDPHNAAPINLTAGQELAITLPLLQERPFKIMGQVEGWHAGDAGHLELKPVFGSGAEISANFNGATARFVITHVPLGWYRLQLFSQGSLYLQRELFVDSDLPDMRLSLAQSRRIPIMVHANDRRARGGHVTLTLKPEDKWQQLVSAGPLRSDQEDYSLLLPPPGKYRVHFDLAPPLYVIAARCGLSDLLREPLMVTGQNDDPIEVTLAYGIATFGGQVRSQGRPVQGYLLVLPVDPAGEPRIQRTDLAGKFAGLQLPPGTYRVWAFDHLPLYYREAGRLEQFASRAQIVKLATDQKLEVTVDLLEVGQSDE